MCKHPIHFHAYMIIRNHSLSVPYSLLTHSPTHPLTSLITPSLILSSPLTHSLTPSFIIHPHITPPSHAHHGHIPLLLSSPPSSYLLSPSLHLCFLTSSFQDVHVTPAIYTDDCDQHFCAPFLGIFLFLEGVVLTCYVITILYVEIHSKKKSRLWRIILPSCCAGCLGMRSSRREWRWFWEGVGECKEWQSGREREREKRGVECEGGGSEEWRRSVSEGRMKV